uniref:Psei6 n=1 Tax=Arundo donax TaxID=35708 RepID=A0A0A8XYR7_ARUDO
MASPAGPSVGAGRRLEGGELAGAGPGLLVHDGHVRRARARGVRRVDEQAVVHPGHHLLLAAHHAAEPQPVAGKPRLLRLPQGPPAELLDVSVAHVRDRAPPAHQHLAAAAAAERRAGGAHRDGEGEEEEEGLRHGRIGAALG